MDDTKKDTSSNILYAGGSFVVFSGYITGDIIRWDGSKWDTLQGGIDTDHNLPTGSGVWKIIKYKNNIYCFGNFY